MRGKGEGKFVSLRPCTGLDYLSLVAWVWGSSFAFQLCGLGQNRELCASISSSSHLVEWLGVYILAAVAVESSLYHHHGWHSHSIPPFLGALPESLSLSRAGHLSIPRPECTTQAGEGTKREHQAMGGESWPKSDEWGGGSGQHGRSPRVSRRSLPDCNGQQSCHMVLSCSKTALRICTEAGPWQELDAGCTLGQCARRALHRCTAAAGVWGGLQPRGQQEPTDFCFVWVYSSKMAFHIHAVNNQGR